MAITLDGTNGITSPDFEPSSSTTPTNGLFLPAANTVGLATGSTERLRIDSSGNLGIGVTPSAWGTAYRTALQVGSAACFAGVSGVGASDYFAVGGNFYLDSGAGYKYIRSTTANRLEASAGEFRWYTAPSGTAGAAISFTQAMTLDVYGRLALGTTSIGSTLRVQAGDTSGHSTGNVELFKYYGTAASPIESNDWPVPVLSIRGYGDFGLESMLSFGYPNDATYQTGNAVWNFRLDGVASATSSSSSTNLALIGPGALILGAGTSERARIDSSGNFLVGDTTAPVTTRTYFKGSATSNSTWSIYAANSAGTVQFGLRNDNYFYAPSIGGYPTTGTTVVVNGNYLGYLSSSLRFKKDIVNYDKGLTEILALRPVYYKSKNPNPDGQYDEQRYAGLIAEEIADLGFDEFVLKGPDGEINSIQYGNMVALCIKAIQELNQRLEALEAK